MAGNIKYSGSTTYNVQQPKAAKGSSHAVRFYTSCNDDTVGSARKKLPPKTLVSSPRTYPAPLQHYPDSTIGKRQAYSTHLSSNLCREQYLHNRKQSSHRNCPTCYPGLSAIRTSDASGLDPNSALAKRRAYAAQPKGKKDSLPRELREHFMYKSQSYTWRRARLMREIKSYFASDVSISPDYKMFWCEDVRPRSRIEQDIELDNLSLSFF